MTGKMIVYHATGALDAPPDQVTELERDPGLEVMQKAVGGYIEAVPGFDQLKGQPCFVFCNERGKLENLPLNRRATLLWEVSLRERGASLRTGNGQFRDVLCGTIVICTGDDAFMRTFTDDADDESEDDG